MKKKDKIWLTATQVMKLIPLDKYDLRKIRMENAGMGLYKQETPGSFRYNWNKLKTLKKTA